MIKKHLLVACIVWFLFLGINIQAAEYHNGLPVVNANSKKASYKISGSLVENYWNIVPKIKHDTLSVICYESNEPFVFITDCDSLSLFIGPNKSVEFYVKLNNKYAHTIISGIELTRESLCFDTTTVVEDLSFKYNDNVIANKYFKDLRLKYPIDSIVSLGKTDQDKVMHLLHWVHTRWTHNGSKVPAKNDAIYILDEAAKGKNYRCVEYGIVLTACLNSVGLKARTLGLMTKDVETRKTGAGHVLTEVYLDDIKKWVVVDGQWDAMPILNGIPLNAVEFQKALSVEPQKVQIESLSKLEARTYINWIHPYLYYFNVKFDNRIAESGDKLRFNDKSKLMLVPVGAKNPEKFQRLFNINYCYYTNAYNNFYREPN